MPVRGEGRVRRLRVLVAVLAALLVCSVIVSVVLWNLLRGVRAELEAPAPPPAAAARAAVVPPPLPPPEPPPVESARAPEDRLLILLTVGTRHYAEKQLRLLRQRCSAPVAVYLQRRGRCGWSQCFALAVREADADRARGCGAAKGQGQTLRDRTDFAVIE